MARAKKLPPKVYSIRQLYVSLPSLPPKLYSDDSFALGIA